MARVHLVAFASVGSCAFCSICFSKEGGGVGWGGWEKREGRAVGGGLYVGDCVKVRAYTARSCDVARSRVHRKHEILETYLHVVREVFTPCYESKRRGALFRNEPGEDFDLTTDIFPMK